MEKIKLALVDDEMTSRNAVKKILEGNDTYEVAADFQNGKTALEWLRKNSIDILLCDMQMPEMDGVELMRLVHIIDEYLPVIAISGFDDFNYVRGSLINGAANYLLKHEITQEKLLYVLDQVRERYRIIPAGREIRSQRGYCMYDRAEFRKENLRKLCKEGKIHFHCHNVIPIAISPDYKFPEGVNIAEYKQDISKAVIDMLNQMLGVEYEYVIYVSRRQHVFLLISFPGERSTLFMLNTMTNLTGRLQRQILRMLDITVTLASGEIHRDIRQALEETEYLEGLLQDKLYLGGSRIISAAMAKRLEYSREEITESLWEQFRFELEHQMEGSGDTLCELLDVMEKERFEYEKMLWTCKEIVKLLKRYGFADERDADRMLESMKEYEEYGYLRTEITELFRRRMYQSRKRRGEKYSPQIEQAVAYIHKNFTEDISLEQCAEVTGVSYTYLSREFKKETGMRFVEFLNRQRVNRAKSLLVRKDISVKKVAELSGFRNYNYFFKVFKEVEGVTPSEFLS